MMKDKVQFYQELIDNFPSLGVYIWRLTLDKESPLQLIATNAYTEKLM